MAQGKASKAKREAKQQDAMDVLASIVLGGIKEHGKPIVTAVALSEDSEAVKTLRAACRLLEIRRTNFEEILIDLAGAACQHPELDREERDKIVLIEMEEWMDA